MTRNRFFMALLAAGTAAVIVLLIPRLESDIPQFGPEHVMETVETGETQSATEPEVPWPSPPSASPLTSEPPSVIVPPADPLAAQVFAEVNERRVAAGLSAVLIDDTLTEVARLHAEDMARRSYLNHTTPEGVTFEMRLNASGYAYVSAAENLGFASHIGLIVPDWMRSPPHRENIEHDAYRRVGVAVAHGTWQGINVVYAAMVFAQPK